MSAEIWSLGIVFYEILEGRTPFDEDNVEKLKNTIFKHQTLQFNTKHHILI
jgi:serine/threonine protein kinase